MKPLSISQLSRRLKIKDFHGNLEEDAHQSKQVSKQNY